MRNPSNRAQSTHVEPPRRSAQERDRNLQVFLAQARGIRRNGDLLRQSFDLMIRIRTQQDSKEVPAMLDNTLIETLSAVTDALEQEGVVHAVAGSVASSLYGEPRMTQDVVIVAIALPDEITRVAARLHPRFYGPSDMLSEAAAAHGLANVVDNATGLRADLSFVPDAGYLADAVRRRKRLQIGTGGPEFWLTTAEDVVLMKLLWRRETQSSKQWEDALGVVRVQGVKLDWKHLFEQADALSISDDLERLRDEAGI